MWKAVKTNSAIKWHSGALPLLAEGAAMNPLDYLREAKRDLTPEQQRTCDDFVIGIQKYVRVRRFTVDPSYDPSRWTPVRSVQLPFWSYA